MESYDTVVEALNGLKEKGYTINFNLAFDRIICSGNKNILNPDEFEITEVYRFEGDSNPDDEDVVYAIESKKGNIKGVLTGAFGMYADAASTEMLRKLIIHHEPHNS
jgi:hypothetical protein